MTKRVVGLPLGALIGAAAIAVGGLGLVAYRAARSPDTDPNADPSVVKVVVTASACQPNELTVPAGKVRFEISNQSARVLEWEILNGVLVVDERENIAPGFRQRLTTTLAPGDYDITCGLLTNPKGRLHATAAAGATPAGKPSLIELIGPMAEYKVYLAGEANAFQAQAAALASAIKAGDADAARLAFDDARSHYARLKPIAALLLDLDARIDPPSPADGGLPALAALAGKGGIADGIALADKMAADGADLQSRVSGLSVPPDRMVGDVALRLRGLAAADAEPDRVDVDAALAGARKVAELFKPLTDKADPVLSARIVADLAALSETLTRLGRREEPDSTAAPAVEDRRALAAGLSGLAGDFSDLARALGLG